MNPANQKNLLVTSLFGAFLWFSLLVSDASGYNRTLYAAIEAETKLLRTLFDGYDNRVRPVTKPDETIHVSFGISFQTLVHLNEAEEHMESISIMLTAWHDGRLSWNRSDYMGIETIKIPANEIWRPDIVSYTSIDEDMNLGETFVQVYTTGHVHWNPTFRLRSPCSVKLRRFPFDKQICSLVFASNMYHGHHLNMTYWGGLPSSALQVKDYSNTNWKMARTSVSIKIGKNACCKEPYPHMEIHLEFKRNPDLYVNMFVVPVLLLGVLVPVTLLMPPESKERVTIGSVVILSLIVQETRLSTILPMGHSELPALSVYHTLTLLWCVLSLCCSIFVINLHNRGPRKSKVPDPVRWIFLRSLRRLVCLGSESYYPLSDTEVITMRGLDKPSTQGQDRTANAGVTSGEARMCPATSKMEKDVDEICRQIALLGSRLTKQDNLKEVLEEWRQLAFVVDRILFFLFFLVFLVTSVFLLA